MMKITLSRMQGQLKHGDGRKSETARDLHPAPRLGPSNPGCVGSTTCIWIGCLHALLLLTYPLLLITY